MFAYRTLKYILQYYIILYYIILYYILIFNISSISPEAQESKDLSALNMPNEALCNKAISYNRIAKKNRNIS
jgi:hypothetical protein